MMKDPIFIYDKHTSTTLLKDEALRFYSLDSALRFCRITRSPRGVSMWYPVSSSQLMIESVLDS